MKQLKGDISAKEQELSEQSAAKTKLNETIGQLEKTGREQKELGAALEADLEAVNEKFSKLQQDHETQMSLSTNSWRWSWRESQVSFLRKKTLRSKCGLRS